MIGLDEYLEQRADQAVDAVIRDQPDFDPPGVKQAGATAIVTSPPKGDGPLHDISGTLRERGLEPDDWLVERCVVNTWETSALKSGLWVTVTNHQLKIFLRSRLGLQLPARTDGPLYLPAAEPLFTGKPLLVAFISDQQAPYIDRVLHELTCEWLAYNHPDILISGGDASDFPSLTRHGRQPHREVSVQDCIEADYAMHRDYVQAAGPHCRVRVRIGGNHDAYIERETANQLPQLAGLRIADTQTEALSIPHLLRLDELGFEYIGNYPHGSFTLPNWPLMWRHGWYTNAKGGLAARKTVETLGCSVVVGHTHFQGIVYITLPHAGPGMTPVTLMAQESGTMAQIKGGLGYNPSEDWQNGFATQWLFPGGGFTAANARFVDKHLYWEDQVYG